ncbi:phosphoglucomutase/phosphomannomutase family protein [Natronomonas sp. F2-12]|jgi:phosphomannomutase|uniref:Phosphoglucomutase/phosphomannomutase family protein n=1 Tax=Natronomonas aquatica TaxID=2841590 RepID=A0A9R1CNT9_9EURY|nr:phosphoglucomutase/phosphomannomutase family protein [Natronomonas aquatica]MCQ4332138.1 phosphoglucomutase/phosphomannomutase family protein [Natronomonas aquatica]
MDIEFGTDGWRTTTESFTGARIRAVGQAVVDHLRAAGEDAPVAVGYDPRAGSRSAAEELCRVLCAGGFDAIVPPRDTPTPIVAWTVTDRDLAGALQVTASHNPPTDNGIKFIPADGAPALPDVTDRLAAELKPPEPLAEPEWGSVEETDLIEPYIEHALAFVDADLEGRTIAYDGMHGSGRGVTNRLLARAGADVEARREDADPEFGGTAPEPTPEHLVDLAQMVENDGAELGIANDGDADRIAVVTPDRGVVDPNWLFAALYDYCLGTDDGDAVRTVSTTFLIDRIAEAHGQAVHETPVGFKWVADAMKEHDALLGGEESGGFGIGGHLRNKDGVLLALAVAAAHSEEPLDDRLDRIREEYGDIVQDRRSVDCPDDRKAAVLEGLAADLPETVAGTEVERVGRDDGFKLLLDDGSWLLVRPSGTEPKLRIYAEAETRERLAELLAAGEALVEPLL